MTADELLADIADLARNRDRLADAIPVSPEARARRDDCLASYERQISRLNRLLNDHYGHDADIPWLREHEGGFTIEDRL